MNDAKMERFELFRELEKRGVAEVIVEFSGGGDEGGVDNISLRDAEGKEIGTLQEDYSYWTNPATDKYEPKPRSKDAMMAEVLSEPVDNKYGSFAGEFHVTGSVFWDVLKRTVKMQGQESHETYDDFEDDDL